MANAVIDGDTYAVWSEAKQRANMDLLGSDIEQAISWFKEQFSTEPNLICLHPKCQQLAGEVPEGIKVEFHHALAHEVLMAATEKVDLVKTDHTGKFFCHSCLTGRPLDARSPDERYCRSCYLYLTEEMIMAKENNKKKAAWWPEMTTAEKTTPTEGFEKCAKTTNKNSTNETLPTGVFAQLPVEKIKADGGSGGRPVKDLPVERIKDLYAQGGKVTDILKQLKAEGYEVSRRTIYNILAGQRVMI
jgi:hypothetical protein